MTTALMIKIYLLVVLVFGYWLVCGIRLAIWARRLTGVRRIVGLTSASTGLIAPVLGAVIILTAPNHPSPFWNPTNAETRLLLDRLFWLLTAIWALSTRWVKLNPSDARASLALPQAVDDIAHENDH